MSETKAKKPKARKARAIKRKRILIVWDGHAWYARGVRVIEHDLRRDEMVYRCDEPIGNDYPSLAQAIIALEARD